ncbi:MAG: primosomal protein N' [Myxococcota bacterium]
MPRPFDGALTYAVPAPLHPLQQGHVVLVPLGRQLETAYVIGENPSPSLPPEKIKPIQRILDPVPAFDDEQLEFFRWAADYFLAPLGMMIHTALPSGIRAKTLRTVVPTDEGALALTRDEAREPVELQVLREIISRPGLTRRGLQRRLRSEIDADDVRKAIDRLVRRRWAAWEEREVGETKGEVRTVSRIHGSSPEGTLGKRMTAILEALSRSEGPVDLEVLLREQGGAARDSLNRLVDRGLVEYGTRERRDALIDAPALGPPVPPPLNEDQRNALAAILEPDAQTILLFGVTGSGKTEVFLGAAQNVLARGDQVLVLVPEIGLTPQLVGRFRARFGDRIAVLHSGLTGAARLAQWRRIRAGEVDVAIGARSALFAPFRSLGLVVVDEEHDDSYKQDEGVAYNARDLAVVLGLRKECPVVLASATPSLESWQNAQRGRYCLVRLPKRATPRPVPHVQVVNLSQLDDSPLLAPVVEEALHDTFERGGQAIVLYNRRGYATLVSCGACGASYECPNCRISMTLHKRERRMVCHYCGLRLDYTTVCPVCQAPELREVGKGTERIEETLQAKFPTIAIGRMDADTTKERGAHHRILSAFREGETQLLVGTQIVAKGHDFPGVQTAVVISADQALRLPDFRSAERTAALLVQLAGRAGRGAVAGRVFVQTRDPSHYVLQHLNDIEAFYGVELKHRALLTYPPYSRLCLVQLDGVDRGLVWRTIRDLAQDLREVAPRFPGIHLLGPAPAALPKIVGRWRFQLIIRGEQVGAWVDFLRAMRSKLEGRPPKGVRSRVDVDPRSLL